MQAQEIIKYINNPSLLNKESIPLLQKLVSDFPYFQSGHILLSIASKKWDTSVYQQSIKKTAIVVTNRNHLYNLIHKPEEIISEEINLTEIENTPVIELKDNKELVVSENLTHKVNVEEKIKAVDENIIEKEVEKAMMASFVEKEVLKINEVVKKEIKPDQGNFSDWLQFLKKNNGQPYNEIEEKVKLQQNKNLEKNQENQILKTKQKQKALIDKIIDNNPGLIRQKEEQKFFKSDFKAKESLLDNEHLVTETLAQIYAMQGNLNKAIRAYEILSLKFPQKSVYFASLIQKLKNNQ